MEGAAKLLAVGLLCVGCSNGSVAAPATVPPYSAEPLPTAVPIATEPTMPATPATPSAAPAATAVPSASNVAQATLPPPTTAAMTATVTSAPAPAADVPDVSIAGEVTSPEQQAVIDTAVRGWRIYREGLQDPAAPNLSADLESTYIDGSLDGLRRYFADMAERGQFVTPDSVHPAVFVPIVPSLVIDGPTASLRSCQVLSGSLLAPGPDGVPVVVGDRVAVVINTYNFRQIDGNWLIFQFLQEGPTMDRSTCSGAF